MDKFLSIDRKIILKSAATGVFIMAALSLLSLVGPMFLWKLAFLGIAVTYWFIPTWFSKPRQLEKRAIASPFKNDKIYGPTMPEYKFFTPEGTEVINSSDKEKTINAILLFFISAILVFVVYDLLIKLVIELFPVLDTIMTFFIIIISVSTPYLIRHYYCFALNRPMDTSLQILRNYSSSNGAGPRYIHKFDNSSFSNTVTSPSYAFLSCNIYHRR